MKDTLVAKRSTLDRMIDALQIADQETSMPPVYESERAFVKLQVICALALAKDAQQMSRQTPEISQRNALDKVTQNLLANIKNIAEEILKNPKLQVDINKELRKISKIQL